MNALNVLCAQLTRDLFAIAKFSFEAHCRAANIFGPLEVFLAATLVARIHCIVLYCLFLCTLGK